MFQKLVLSLSIFVINSIFLLFQVDEDNHHCLRANPAIYTPVLNSAARGLYRYELRTWGVGTIFLLMHATEKLWNVVLILKHKILNLITYIFNLWVTQWEITLSCPYSLCISVKVGFDPIPGEFTWLISWHI